MSADDLIVRQEVDLDRDEIVEWMASMANIDAAGKVDGFENIDLSRMWNEARKSLFLRDGSVTFLRTPTFVKTLDGNDPTLPEPPNFVFKKIEITNLFTAVQNPDAAKFHPNQYLVVFSFGEKAGNYTAEVIFLHDGMLIKSKKRKLSDYDRALIEDAKKASDLHIKEIESFIKREIE
jgi:hypothetical protein